MIVSKSLNPFRCSKRFLASNINRLSGKQNICVRKYQCLYFTSRNIFGSELKQARKQPAVRSTLTTFIKKRKPLDDENKKTVYGKTVYTDPYQHKL